MAHRGSQFEHALSRNESEPSRPAELVRIEREITLGTSSAGHLHTRLLPLLREAAAARLGIDLELRPDRARAVLGEETWELVRPDRPEPHDRNAPGLPIRRVRAVVESLEQALMELQEVRDRGAAVLDEVERAIVGKRDALELILLALLSDGHVLLEDYPGLAKTLIARSFAQATSLDSRASSSRPT